MTNSKLIRRMMEIGLSENEGEVYCSLMSSGSASVADLARDCKLHRADISTALRGLQQYGLVSLLQKGRRTHYVPEDPQTLRNIFARKQELLEDALPDLSAIFSQRALRPTVRFFIGKIGIAEVYHDMVRSLKKGDVFFRYESPEDYREQDRYIPKAYLDQMCGKRNIEKFVITNEATWHKKPKQLERYVKTVPSSFDRFEYNVSQIIYADKVAFIDFEAESAWIVESARFATFQRQLFKLFLTKL